MNYSEMFRVKPGSKLRLSVIDPDFTDKSEDAESVKTKTKQYIKRLSDLQFRLYAESKWSLLICLQGMDTAGKDGTITHVLSAMNPLGTRVYAFKVPSPEEAAHDFLWRIEKQVPAKGEVVIFNRSHYEDVLIARVHNLVSQKVWSGRYEIINNFEKGLFAHGTHILKFYLHISPEEQLKRLQKRLDDPKRQWKISESDYADRKLWNEYTIAYEDALSKTSTFNAPWFVIPANHKLFRNLAVSKIVAEKLESMGVKYPQPQVDINAIKQKYHQAQATT